MLLPLRWRRPLSALVSALFALPAALTAQSPIVLPYTISTVAGNPAGAPTSVGVGNFCSGTSGPKATSAYNDGCPASQLILSTGTPAGGTAVDPEGNIYVDDTSNQVVHKIDARSGLTSVLVGLSATGGTTSPCAAATDKYGDNCPLASAGQFNNPRGIGSDPYGNLFLAGYSDQVVHEICLYNSPTCTGKLGTFVPVAGCVAPTTAGASQSSNSGKAVTSANAADNVTPYVSSSSTTGCSATGIGGLNQPRGANGDLFGNIYIGDTGNTRYRVVLGPASYNGLTNPLYAILKITGSPYAALTLTPGYIYSLAGTSTTGFTAKTTGASCGTGATSFDADGDNCPFYNAGLTYASGGGIQAIDADNHGNIFFGDSGLLRVIYAGDTGNAAVKAAILANNPGVTPQPGYTYLLSGNKIANTTVALSTRPQLGTGVAGNSFYHIAVDKYGNLFLGDNSSNVDFYDMQTGFIRLISVAGGPLCSTGAGGTPNAVGDGCPATQSIVGSSNSLGVAVDTLGNLYLNDVSHQLIRKISAVSFANTTQAVAYSPAIETHSVPGTTGQTATLAAPSNFTLGTAACTTNSTTGSPVGDGSFDCVYPVTVNPNGTGLRETPLTVTNSGTAGTLVTGLSTVTNGSNFTFDPTSTAPASTSIVPATVSATATDGANNNYFGNATAIYKDGASIGAPAAAPLAISVDQPGNIYYTTGAGAQVYVLNGSAIPTPGYVPGALVSDAPGNLYFFDKTSKQIVSYFPTSQVFTTLTTTAFSSVSGITLDAAGNLVIADSGAGAVYRLPKTGGTQTAVTVTGNPIPAGVAVDSSNSIYVADSAGKSVVLLPANGAQRSIASTSSSVAGVAVDGLGNVFIADVYTSGPPAAGGGTEIARSAVNYTYPNTSTPLTGNVTNAGTLATTGFAESNNTNFNLYGTGATCTATTSLSAGTSCSINASAVGSNTTGSATGTVQFTPVANSFGLLTLNATVPTGVAITTATTISAPTPANPSYNSSTTEASFTITVTAQSGTAAPTGTVNYSIDGGPTQSAALTAGSGTSSTATINVAGLAAGQHTLTASYPTTGNFSASSTTGSTTFAIAQASTAITWNPAYTTQQVSAAVGTGVLNAYATNTSNGNVVPGTFVYLANNGTSTVQIDPASYLPLGSYTLSVTFIPSDTGNFGGSSKTLSTAYTVTKASTTGAVGGTIYTAAPSGTAYTTVESAVVAAAAAGGTPAVYVAPGTYTEQVLISNPNFQVHGLGGDATRINITAENGAFSGSTTTFGFNNDEGASTFTIAPKNGLTPNNFYMDYVSLTNTYDTDTTNTTARTSAQNGANACTGTTNMSNFAAYNANILCGSQAIALYVTADKSVFNNVRLNSLQDTLATFNAANNYPACSAGTSCVSRQYYFRSYIAGDVDYVFGDSASVFDQSTFNTLYHYNTPTGSANIFAQSKDTATGAGNDYLSGYVANNTTFVSEMDQGPMTALALGRPLANGQPTNFGTTVLINASIDDVLPAGYVNGNPSLAGTDMYFEYNTLCTSANCSTNARETVTAQPVNQTQAFITPYLPGNFLGNSTLTPDTWNAPAALAAGVNGFVPPTPVTTITAGQSYTLLARPRVPGAGVIPTGSYTLTMDGASILGSPATLTGTLDASGTAYGILPASMLPAGNHTFVFTYNGDANFSASSAGTFTLSVQAQAQTITFPQPTTPQTVGNTDTLAATSSSGLPVTYAITSGTATLNGSQITYTTSGPVTITASQAGNGTYAAATPVAQTVQVNPSTNATFSVVTASTAHNGVAQTLVVTARDGNGNTLTGFTGTVTFTSSDPLATLPAPYTFVASDNGTHTFNVRFGTQGSQTVTVTGSNGATGTQSNVIVGDQIWIQEANGTIEAHSDDGSIVAQSPAGPASPYRGIAIDNPGNAYSVIPSTNQVSYTSRDFSTVNTAQGGGLSAPSAVAVDGFGQIWIANGGAPTVSVFTNALATAVTGTTGYSTATSASSSQIVIDDAGNVWTTQDGVSNGSGTVSEIIGAAAPVDVLANGVKNLTLGARP